MGDISVITAGRAAALRNEARFQRNQQQQTGIRQDEERRVATERQARAIQEQNAARARRAQNSIDDRRQLDIERSNINLNARAVEDDVLNRRASIRETDALNAQQEARALNAEAAEPRLTPRIPINDLSEGRFQEAPPPLPPAQDPATAIRTPEEQALARQGPLAAFDPPPDLGPLARFQSPEETLTAAVDFQLQERERTLRVSQREDDARVIDTEQRTELQRADQRLAQTTQANPNLPRGSIVNVLG